VSRSQCHYEGKDFTLTDTSSFVAMERLRIPYTFTLEELLVRARELGYPALALTDHQGTPPLTQSQKLALGADIQYMVPLDQCIGED
jgi:hypothetical protein